MRRIAFIALSVVAALAALAGSVFFAAGPALDAARFPPQAIVSYPGAVSAAAPRRTLTVVTYNLGYAYDVRNNQGRVLGEPEVRRNLDAMLASLRPLQPDVLALQEVDFDAARTFGINQLEYLAKGLAMPFGAYAVTWNKRYVAWPYWPPRRQFGRIVSGQAVLSRYPIRKQEAIRFAKPEENAFWYNWFYLDRVAQRLVVDLPAGPAVFWNVHLEAFRPATRLAQAGQLARAIQEGETPPREWVGGDFNSASRARAARSETSEADDAALTHLLAQVPGLRNAEQGPIFYTMPSWAPERKIDHILYRGAMTLQETGTISGLTASDHLPVWARFSFP